MENGPKGKKRWGDEEVKVLIFLYQQKELLYNAHLPEYSNREKRHQAYEEITDRLRYMRKEITIDDVKAKIELMRRQYLAELNKMHMGFSQIRYVPSIWWFNSMKFIESHLKRKVCDTNDVTPEVDATEIIDEYEETPHRQSNGVSATKRIDNFKNNVTPGSSRPFIGQDAAYTPMSDLMSESRSFSPENEQFNTSNKKKSKPSRKELRYQTDAALLQFLQNSNDTSTSKVSEKPFGEFIATELEKIQCIDIREEVKWEIQLAIRKGIQQALQTNTHSSLCSVPPNQMSMDSSDKEYFVINNVE